MEIPKRPEGTAAPEGFSYSLFPKGVSVYFKKAGRLVKIRLALRWPFVEVTNRTGEAP